MIPYTDMVYGSRARNCAIGVRHASLIVLYYIYNFIFGFCSWFGQFAISTTSSANNIVLILVFSTSIFSTTLFRYSIIYIIDNHVISMWDSVHPWFTPRCSFEFHFARHVVYCMPSLSVLIFSIISEFCRMLLQHMYCNSPINYIFVIKSASWHMHACIKS